MGKELKIALECRAWMDGGYISNYKTEGIGLGNGWC